MASVMGNWFFFSMCSQNGYRERKGKFSEIYTYTSGASDSTVSTKDQPIDLLKAVNANGNEIRTVMGSCMSSTSRSVRTSALL